MLEKVIDFVNESFSKGKNEKSLAHFRTALHYLEILYPDADEAMKIGAYGHDVARAFRETNTIETFRDKYFNDPEILTEHMRTGAAVMLDFLLENRYGVADSIRVYSMIRFHEVGGTEEADWIMDVDSVSFFEVNVPKFLEFAKVIGKEKVKKKFDWMYYRIKHEKARELVEPMYREAVAELEKL